MYRFVDHTADVAIEACGESLERVLELLGRALFEAMLEVDRVERKVCREFKIEGKDEEVVVNLLEKLIYYKDAENLALPYVRIEGNTVRVCGEEIDPRKHEPFSDVKAVSWHGLRVWEEKGKVCVFVVLDV